MGGVCALPALGALTLGVKFMLTVADNLDRYRDMGGGKDLASPFNEGFSFTPKQYEILKITRPALFDADPQRRLAAWHKFARTSEGRAFRVR